MIEHKSLYVDGEWVPADSTDSVEVIEAATEEAIGWAPLGNRRDIGRAVESARNALDRGPWGRMSATDRASLMLDFAGVYELARLGSTTKPSTPVRRSVG
ncbi:aldehyde dehydrogenase family protein [Rhodococcus sp. NPDC059968]|uniref:aldehyde dehydrogenase family protein n=1 Tax=Rhodococcus sp. NPDC059968 TaxID=3347017 RepID=UPI003671A836